MGLLLVTLTAGLLTQAPEVDAGPLRLSIVVSESAQVFHIVDQLSMWSPYSHPQYRRFFEGQEGGGLTPDDEKLLAAHAELRKRMGYGALDQTFYVEGTWQAALDAAAVAKRLDLPTVETERKVLAHFHPRVRKLIDAKAAELEASRAALLAQRGKLKDFAEKASRFWGGSRVEMSLYLVATPRGGDGGGFNGGKLVVEVEGGQPPVDVTIHETWHAFAQPRQADILTAAKAAGTDWETMSEGLAYAVSPGIYSSSDRAELETQVHRHAQEKKSFSAEPYVRFNRLGLALRPLMQTALEKGEGTFATFLPRAVDVYRSLAEVSLALERENARLRYFIFGSKEAFQSVAALAAGNDVWGRGLSPKEFDELAAKMRVRDVVVFAATREELLALPRRLADAWASEWPKLKAHLERRPSGLFRAVTAQGTRVAVWGNDGPALAAELAKAELKKALLPER